MREGCTASGPEDGRETSRQQQRAGDRVRRRVETLHTEDLVAQHP